LITPVHCITQTEEPVLSEQYVLSEPDQMPVYYCLFTDYCLLLTDHWSLFTDHWKKSSL